MEEVKDEGDGVSGEQGRALPQVEVFLSSANTDARKWPKSNEIQA